ncbi:MAG: RHS repeat-associated core domain-containing protein [Acidobacteriia bacterium]|nr:RHS repeat-associated core domain-containing protein [Terriglobia bacterium]
MKRTSGSHVATVQLLDRFPRALRFGVLCVSSLVLAISGVSAGEIQNDQIGLSTNHVFESALQGENVDVMTGNLNLTIPIGPKYMVNDHFGYQMTLYYNSKLWEHDCTSIDPHTVCSGTLVADDTYGLGFRLGFGRIYQRKSVPASVKDDKSFVFRYQAPDGAEHFFCDVGGHLWDIDNDTNAHGEERCVSGYTLDGTGIKIDHITTPTEYWEVLPGDGTKITFGAHNVSSSIGWYATKIEDVSYPAQNVTIQYATYGGSVFPPELASVTDSLGRVITYTPGNPATLRVPSFAGSETHDSNRNATYSFTFSSDQVYDPVDTNSTWQMKKFLTKISYPLLNPSAEYYGFSYFGPGDELNAGYLTGRHLPTGADIDYYYAWYPTNPKRPYHMELFFKTLFADGRSTPGGRTYKWSWSRFGDGVIRSPEDIINPAQRGIFPASNPQEVKVLDPFDNLTVYWFGRTLYGDTGCNAYGDCASGWADGLLYYIFYYSGAESGDTRLVKHVDYSYDYAGRMFQYRVPLCGPDCTWPPDIYSIAVDPRTTEERTTYAGDGANPEATRRVVYSEWTSGCISKPKQVTEYDGELPYRSTWTEYESTPEYHDAHRFVEVRNASGEVVSRTDRHFTLDHLDCEIVRNGTIGADRLACPGSLTYAGDVGTTYSYDSAGNLSSTTERGGDDGASWTASYTHCAGGYLCGKQYGGITWNALDRDIDFNTGLVIASRDPAGTETTYDWDDLGRLKSISPVLPERPTTMYYPSLLQTSVTREVASDDFTQITYVYDNLGRQIETRRRDLVGSSVSPPSLDFQKTQYDIEGRVLCRSDWADMGTTDTDLKWTKYSYLLTPPPGSLTCDEATHVDPVGRVHKVERPDGSKVETDYAGLATMVTVCGLNQDPASGTAACGMTTTRVNDALGRLASVTSPASAATATYTYDELDHLVEVKLIDPAHPTVMQLREFTFDPLGQLRRATNPENGTVEYLSYDARGNLLQFRDARQSLFVNTYDAASRLTQRSIRLGGGDQTLVENTYDTEFGEGSGAVNGKLTRQRSFKLVNGLSALVADQQFGFGPPNDSSPCDSEYKGLNGRLAWHRQNLEPWCTDVVTEYCQDSMGHDSLVAYPDFSGSGRTRSRVINQFKNGFLWEIHDWDRNLEYLHDVSYDPSGDVTEIVRGNTIRDTIDRDVMSRPSRIRVLSSLSPVPHPPIRPPSQVHPRPVGDGPGLQVGRESNDPNEIAAEQALSPLWDTGVYAYDGAGNVRSIGSTSYQYDGVNRLVQGPVAVTPSVINPSVSYRYDAFGNYLGWQTSGYDYPRHTLTVDSDTNRVSQQEQVYWPGAWPVVHTFWNYYYDQNGNMVSQVRTTGSSGPTDTLGFTYDVQNRLEAVSNTVTGTIGSYDYDADGYRVRSETDGAETFYLRDPSGQVLSEFRRTIGDTDSPVWDKDYVYAFGKVFGLVKNEVPRTLAEPWAEQVTSTGLTLKWKAGPDPDILGYVVQAAYQQTLEYHATTFDYEITDGSMTLTDTFPFEAGTETRVTYTVMAMDTAANVSDPSPALIVHPGAANGPPTPTGLTAEAGDRRVQLLWNAITAEEVEDIRGYYVDRSSGGAWVRLTSSVVGQANYLDVQVSNGTTYSYRVWAVDTSGRLSSSPSTTASARPHDTIPPAKPVGVEAEADRETGKIRLFWRAVLDPDVASYLIYRSETQGVVGPLVATRAKTTADPEQYVDPVTEGATHYYRIGALDSSGNASELSGEVSARPRRADISAPTLQSAVYGVDQKGTTSIDGYTYDPPLGHTNPDGCNVDSEDDDVIQVVVTWTATNLAEGYRVYRAEGAGGRFYEIAEVPNSATSYPDTDASAADYTYYVVATKTIGVVKEESGGSGTIEATDFFSTNSSVRNLQADYGVGEYGTYNNASRLVRLFWSRVPTSQLVGYHVYRRCKLFDYCGFGGPQEHRVDAFSCEPTWVRLTDGPVSDNLRVFDDRTIGGLKGCYDYAVRPVGPDFKEGNVTKILEANVSPQTDLSGTCLAGGWDEYDPTWNQPDWSNDNAMARINGQPRTLAPDYVQVHWYEKAALNSQQPSVYVWVTWDRVPTRNWPDLAGFYIEVAGSDNGPWTRVTQHPVAWWENHWASMGEDVKLSIYNAGVHDWVSQYYGHARCLRFRVISVDESGTEYWPATPSSSSYYWDWVSTYPSATCSSTPTPTAPENLHASTAQAATPCSTKLEWDPVDGASKYNVYRMVLMEGYYFYRTHIQTATVTVAQHEASGTEESYIEAGEQDNRNYYTTTENTCPFWQGVGDTTTYCTTGHLEAYYVTAENAVGGESPRSNVVFWNCAGDLGYSRLWTPDHETGDEVLLASMGAGAMNGPVCSETPLLFNDRVGGLLGLEGHGLPDAPRAQDSAIGSPKGSAGSMPAVAPFTKLGSFPDPPWALYDLHTDHLGSVRLVTDDEGNVIAQHDYVPFGDEVPPQLDYTTHMFTGHERDAGTGLDYMLGRYYASVLGRFVNVDPTTDSVDVQDAQTWNRYSYARNNPMRFIDLLGEATIDAPTTYQADVDESKIRDLTGSYYKEGAWIVDMGPPVWNDDTCELDITYSPIVLFEKGLDPAQQPEVKAHEDAGVAGYFEVRHEEGYDDLDQKLTKIRNKYVELGNKSGWTPERSFSWARWKMEWEWARVRNLLAKKARQKHDELHKKEKKAKPKPKPQPQPPTPH